MSLNADRVGSLLFCPTCGTLLSLPRDGESTITCEQCAHQELASFVTTRSAPEAFPSALRQKRKTQTKQHDQGDQGTLTKEKCPSCGHVGAYSKELQLRSADEGSTVFYTCASCKHGWRINN